MVWWSTFRLLFVVLLPFGVVSHIQGDHFLSFEEIPVTSFSCAGRSMGYYADTETGCQVYHMCEAGGRQFSYSCPNTTLFHQRMLICAHWYQVNCNHSESYYDANLLIGQRDKPFVSDEEHKYFNYRKRLPSHGVQRTTGARAYVNSTESPTSSTIQQDSVEFNNNTLLPRLLATTLVNHTSTPDVPSTSHDKNTFINRFVYQERVPNNDYTESEYKYTSGKDVNMYDFKIKSTSFGAPSLYLQPPRYNKEEEENKIELVFEDPRRIFYIGENESESVNAEQVLVTIRFNKSAMSFRNRHNCDKCHPLFVTHKDTCTPCVVVVR